MFFWKIDEETIRCLIHKQEIHSMGFDLDALTQDHAQMEAFLNAIVQSSRNYIDWHTENGIQNYIAKSLPADQLLVTISCTFPDVAIDRDLEQIKKMTTALNARITDERIEQIYAMTGEEKERAFEEMSKDLHDVCMGNIETEEEESSQSEDPVIVKGEERTDAEEQKSEIPPKKIVFSRFSSLVRFCSLLEKSMHLESSLYRMEEEYTLLVDFSRCTSEAQALAFILTAEEYGGQCGEIRYEEAYLREHGQLLLGENAIAILSTMEKK